MFFGGERERQRHERPDAPSHPRRGANGPHHLRREGSGHEVSADRAHCGRPKGAPNVLVILIDDVGFGASSAFGGPCQTPNAERLAAGGLKYNRFHTTALCSPTRQALLTGRNHHSVGMGGITEIATGSPGYCSVLPNTVSPLARDAEAERLRHGAVRQVPRSAGVGDEPGRPVRCLAHRRRRLRILLRLHRRRGAPVVSRRSTRARRRIEVKKTPEEGYHFMEDMTDKAIGWIGQQKALDPRQAVLRLLRAGRDACAAPRAEGMGGQVQGQVRRGLGQAARGDLCAAEEARRHPAGLPAHARATRRSPRGTTCRRI